MTGNDWDAERYDSEFRFVSRYGDDLLDLLDPQPGEHILDLGCGTGRHAAAMTELGAVVTGFDADADMVGKARREHEGVRFVMGDAADLSLAALDVDSPFDAVFSNAALHWMTDQYQVLCNVRGVLAESGRFVAEMGGDGNISALDASLRGALSDMGLNGIPIVSNHFPTIGQQSALLESAGFRVEQAHWFRRPTPLEPPTTAADWTRHFRASTWAAVPIDLQAELAARIDAGATARGLLTEGGWIADYCRLRFLATATGQPMR